MKKTLLLFLFSALASLLVAQTPRREISKNVRCSAGSNLAYPGPTHHRLTAPPAGMKPFYVNLYGSQGSCYLTKSATYDAPYLTLSAADSLGKLTTLGRDVLQRLKRIRDDAFNHWGELTPLGNEQQRQIVGRIHERFPEVFAGKARVEARSVPIMRCLLAMENALQQLSALVPQVDIYHYASQWDLYYLSPQEQDLSNMRLDLIEQQRYDRFLQKYNKRHDRLMRSLFNDMNYVHHEVDADKLNCDLFKVASNIQSTSLRREITLYDLFTDEELYHNWQRDNVGWYMAFGNGGSGQKLYSQQSVIDHIISEVDSVINNKRNGVGLHYSHQAVVLPLCCQLNINGCGLVTDHLETLERKGWVNYRIIPMAANVQLVFYRRNADDKDILFKVLLNENEATLPLKAVDGPYYRWADFKEYYHHNSVMR